MWWVGGLSIVGRYLLKKKSALIDLGFESVFMKALS
jgi:hypothetical protein